MAIVPSVGPSPRLPRHSVRDSLRVRTRLTQIAPRQPGPYAARRECRDGRPRLPCWSTDRAMLRRRHRNDEIACSPIYFMDNYCNPSKSAAFSSDESSRPVPLLHHHHHSFSTGEQLNHALSDGGSTRDRRGRRHGAVVGLGLCSHPGRRRRIVAGCSGFRPAPAALRSPSDRRRPAPSHP